MRAGYALALGGTVAIKAVRVVTLVSGICTTRLRYLRLQGAF